MAAALLRYAAARGDFAKTLSTFSFYSAVPALIKVVVSQGAPSQVEDWPGCAAKAVMRCPGRYPGPARCR
jgi:hypothetical protein